MNDNHQPERHMLDEAIAAFKQMTVPARPSDADTLAQFTAKQAPEIRPLTTPRVPPRRFLMRTLLSSAAASLVLLTSLVVITWHSAPSVALADVIQAAEKQTLLRYKQEQTTDSKSNGSGRTELTVYADLTKPRTRSESHDKKNVDVPMIIEVQDHHRHLIVNPAAKTAWIGAGNKDYKSFLGGLQEFQKKKGVITTNDKLEGKDTVKYRLEEGGNTTQLWVDAATKLPVRMEYEMIDPTPDISRNRFVWTDFEWNPALPPAFKTRDELFSTQPLDGYTVDDQTKK